MIGSAIFKKLKEKGFKKIITVEKSKLDLTISTSLLEKRFIAGNEQNFHLLNTKFNSFIANSKTLNFVEAKLKESDLRHKRAWLLVCIPIEG